MIGCFKMIAVLELEQQERVFDLNFG